jgi:hypothetical protein
MFEQWHAFRLLWKLVHMFMPRVIFNNRITPIFAVGRICNRRGRRCDMTKNHCSCKHPIAHIELSWNETRSQSYDF